MGRLFLTFGWWVFRDYGNAFVKLPATSVRPD